MSTIIEELRARTTTAQARHQAAHQRFQAAQAEVNAAAADYNIWNNALNVELREEAARAAEAAKNQLPMDLSPDQEEHVETEVASRVQTEAENHLDENEEPVNKTEAVRDLLRQHATGMTPAAIWAAFHQIAPRASRNYLYSVLKRLRDKDEVTQRRGKYVLKVKPVPESGTVEVDEQFKGGLIVS